MGSVHMGTGICFLDAAGAIQPHLHSFEESFYILEGTVAVEIGEKTHTLGPGNFGLIPTGTAHSWKNAGSIPRPAGLEMQARRSRGPWNTAGILFSTLFSLATRLSPTRLRQIGHFDESQRCPGPAGASQMEGFNPTTGVAIKMFVDRSFGATHQSLFLIQYSPGAKIDPVDHTFEEVLLHQVGGRVHRRSGRQELRPRSGRRNLDRRRLHPQLRQQRRGGRPLD